MSYNFNFIAIEGDYRKDVAQWCESAGYLVGTTANADMPTVKVSSEFKNERTLIHDGAVFDEPFLVQLDERINSRIVQVACGGTADSFGFQSYADGQLVRVFWVLEGEILEDTGQPIDEENGLEFNSSTSEGEMLALASRFGFDPSCDDTSPDYYLTLIHQPATPSSTSSRFLGRILSTLICTIIAFSFFRIAPRTQGFSWPIDFLMWYGLSANVYLALFYSGLSTVIPDRWRQLLEEGFLLQLFFAILFLVALFVFKVTGHF